MASHNTSRQLTSLLPLGSRSSMRPPHEVTALSSLRQLPLKYHSFGTSTVVLQRMVSLEAEHRLVACELRQLQNTSTTTSVAFNTLQSRVSSSVEALEAREEKTATHLETQ